MLFLSAHGQKKFWQELKYVTAIKIPPLYPYSWACDLLDDTLVSSENAAVILCETWAVWSEQNARQHEERTRSVSESVKWTADIAMDLSILGRASNTLSQKIKSKWQPPVIGIFKMNVDAGFRVEADEGSTGAILRDHAGIMRRGQAIWYGNAANALAMEALAVRDGVKLAYEMGISHVIVETDCAEVVKRWLDREKDRSEITSIIHEVEELSGNFISFRLNYIGREANEGAHLCAKQASASRRRCIWINYVPSFRDCLTFI